MLTDSNLDRIVVSTEPEPCDYEHANTKSCCSSANKCSYNQGNCFKDNHCIGNLLCGSNNCDTTAFPNGANCCYKPATVGGMNIN